MTPKDKKLEFIKREERHRGHISFATYVHYFRSMKYSWFFLPVILCLLLLSASLDSVYRYFVALWSADDKNMDWIEKFFFLFCFVAIAVRTLNWLVLIGFLENGARNLHAQMVTSFSRAKISFFDENPTGRLVRRFSGDYFQLKDDLPQLLSDLLGSLSELLVIFMVVIFQAPVVIVSIFPCGFMYFRVQGIFKPASREMQRLLKILESPLWSLFTESVVGYQTIRAYNRTQDFYDRFLSLTYGTGKASLILSRFTRWLNFRLKLISELFSLFVAFGMIFLVQAHKINVGVAGFLMSLTLGLDASMQWLTRSLSLIEAKMVSAERIIEYKNLPSEVSVDKKKSYIKNFVPLRGEIKFDHFVASYRKDLRIILKDLTLTFEPNKKTGIIGRTGAGKSSLFQALFRMMHVHSGRILIDGVNIATLDLELSRSFFAVVPQDPYLFSGSIAENLDRTHKYGENDVWEALEKVELAQYVYALPEKLNYHLAEGGANLSLGQRQLLCIARAVLTRANIILMDEATASVDLETDALIQKAIATVFANKTVLVIAHRLETLESADKIVVMEGGQLHDYGDAGTILAKYAHGLWERL